MPPGADSTDFGVSDVVISPDGTKVAFVMESSDLGPTDSNGVEDVYLRDLSTGESTLMWPVTQFNLADRI